MTVIAVLIVIVVRATLWDRRYRALRVLHPIIDSRMHVGKKNKNKRNNTSLPEKMDPEPLLSTGNREAAVDI